MLKVKYLPDLVQKPNDLHAPYQFSQRHVLHIRMLPLVLAASLGLGACARLPPGVHFPKLPSAALAYPSDTRLGRHFEAGAREHGGTSGYRLLSTGADGLVVRAQMIDAAEHTLDLQYYIFHEDRTGSLLTDALLRAADRGVRVRILLDESERVAGDKQIDLLDAHPGIEVRLFNPFFFRDRTKVMRGLEFLLNPRRLDYRMHNKLLVADNAAALVGGRNIGDEYFQGDTKSQFGDDDVFAGGPVVGQLSATFDEYWQSDFAVPVRALGSGRPSPVALDAYRARLVALRHKVTTDRTDYLGLIAKGEPLAGMISGALPLEWTTAQLVYDSPDKRRIDKSGRAGSLIYQPVLDTMRASNSELLIVTPYLIPGSSGMRVLEELRGHNVRVRILTNSLETTLELAGHSGYMGYRQSLLEHGVELYEVRARLGTASGSGESSAMAAHGTYALHAKLFVFDRTKVLIGSFNFDLRSEHRNTEVGLIINSPTLAQQTATRFAALVQPANSYELVLRRADPKGPARLVWRTREGDTATESGKEPGSAWRKIKIHLLTLLPLDSEL